MRKSDVTRFAHVVRGGIPTQADRMLATRMGEYAVEQLLLGKSNIVICQREGELVDTDIAYALTVDAMYKNKLSDEELANYDEKTLKKMQSFVDERRRLMARLYGISKLINL